MLKRMSSRVRISDPRQLSFDFAMVGLESPPMPPSPPRPIGRTPDPVFFAHHLAEETATAVSDRIPDIRYQNGLQGRARPSKVLHISLHAVGPYADLSTEMLGKLRQGAETIQIPPFEVTFDRVTSFGSGDGVRPIVLLCADGKDELTELYDAFDPAMEKVGLCRSGPRRPFTPHMTLLYDRKVIPETPLDEPITIAVGDFALIHSLYGRTRYDVLGRWPLNG